METKKYALIIGGGPAGLTAAYRLLLETDYLPIIVEAEDFVGGISRTAQHHGNRIDIGGHRFFTKNAEVMSLWQTLLPPQGSPSYDDLVLQRPVPLTEGGPDPESQDKVFLVRNRVSRIYYLKKFFDYPISLSPRTFLNMGLPKTMQAGFGYLHSLLRKREEKNLEDFMINRFGTPLYSMFFRDYTEKVWGRHPRDISADWGAQRIKGLNLLETLKNAVQKTIGQQQSQVETSLIETYYYPKKGPGQLWETLADRIVSMGGQLLLGHCVQCITLEDSKINAVKIQTSLGETKVLHPTLVFSSMAISDLVAAMGDTPVPPNIQAIAKSLPYRDFITVGLLVDKLKLKNTTKLKTLNNIVPDCWIYVQESEVHMGRIQIFNNWSPYMVENPDRQVWLGLEYFCNEGDALWSMPEEDFITLAIDELCSMDIIEHGSVLDSVRIRVKKAYPAYFGTYEQFNLVQNYLNSIENLYCIGRNGQHRYNNMDHSMLSAMEAVRACQGKSTKEAVWAVNTEQDYHETSRQGGTSS